MDKLRVGDKECAKEVVSGHAKPCTLASSCEEERGGGVGTERTRGVNVVCAIKFEATARPFTVNVILRVMGIYNFDLE